jgi:hypothetical protein
VRDELLQRELQVRGAEQDQAFEAFALDGLHESLGDRLRA